MSGAVTDRKVPNETEMKAIIHMGFNPLMSGAVTDRLLVLLFALIKSLLSFNPLMSGAVTDSESIT